MKKVTCYALTFVLAFFFLFPQTVQANQTNSENFIMWNSAGGMDFINIPLQQGIGEYETVLYDTPFTYTASLSHTFTTDYLNTQNPDNLYQYILYNMPTVTFRNSGYISASVNEVRAYFIIDGIRYEVRDGSYVIMEAAKTNKVTILFEADISGVVMPRSAELGGIQPKTETLYIDFGPYDASVSLSGLSDIGLLRHIATNTEGVKTWLTYINDTILNFNQSMNNYLVQLHGDNATLKAFLTDTLAGLQSSLLNQTESIVTWLGYINDNITALKTSMETKLGNINDNISDFKATMTTWASTINANITDFKSTMTTWFQNIRDNLNENFTKLGDKITKGYDPSNGDGTISDIGDITGGLSDAEDDVIGGSLDGMNGFTINEDGIGGMLAQYSVGITLVSAMMQSFYESMGSFGIIIAIGFSITITCMLTGMFRFFK